MDDLLAAGRWATADVADEIPARATPWSARSRVLLGMPQLDGCGLSENWLQKSCGEAHWRGLAARLGLPAERWVDACGQRVYAAFGMLRLRGARLGDAREGESLRMTSRLAAVGRSQAWSRHVASTGAGRLAELEMLSVFVGRGDDGSNRSVRRVAMRERGAEAEPADALAMVEQARAWRAESPVPGTGPVQRFLPCPRGDFNGAGLVYFPSFSAWADRALFAWGLLGARDRVVQRECLFLGNLDMGHPVEIVLCGESATAAGPCLEVLVRCPSHGRRLAVIRTTVAR